MPGMGFFPGGPTSTGAPGQGGPLMMDPFMTSIASNVLRPYGENYLQRGQAFMQSRFSFLSYGSLHYYFNISGEYVRKKLLMLLVPFLKQWTFTRTPEQISGGNKYLPPRQDVNAPDLYIPLAAFWTYCVLTGLAAYSRGSFTPEVMYTAVSSAALAWLLHLLLLKATCYLLGATGAVPLLEAAAYAGYPYVVVCLCVVARLLAGTWPFYGIFAYTGIATAIVLVRTMKRVLYQEAQQYSVDASQHNYLLLFLAMFQFVFIFWMSLKP